MMVNCVKSNTGVLQNQDRHQDMFEMLTESPQKVETFDT